MNNKFNNFLLGFLWLTISTLALCFWFNINFGFNLLSGAHWRHLAYMQASQQPIKPMFYISLIIGLGFIIAGLYILIRPKLRRIKFPKRHTRPEPATPELPPAPVITDEPARPARLTNTPLPTINTDTELPPAPVVAPISSATQSAAPEINITNTTIVQDYPEITEIFKDAGYTIKESPCLGNFCPALVAIGNQTVLWVGAVDVATDAVQGIIDAFQTIFHDTLEDIEIDTRGFVINATDSNAPKSPNILCFDTIEELRTYIQDHPNNPDPDDQDGEGFEAYSTYISTVIKHLGQI